MYGVSFKYLIKPHTKWTPDNNLGFKGGFASEKQADDWVLSQLRCGNIEPLKLLVWDETIQCYSMITKYKN